MQNLPNSANMYLRIAYILCQWMLMYEIMGHVRNLVCDFQPSLGFCEWERVDSVAFPSRRCYTFSGWLLFVTHSSWSLCGFCKVV